MRRRLLPLVITVCLMITAATAWGYWTPGSVSGGNGAAAASNINQGATPTVSRAGRSVTVSWAASTLANGQPVSGYLVKRYSGSTAQTVLTACNGTITGTSCVEDNVPVGTWTYSITPLFATAWSGPESLRSSTVTVTAATLALSATTVRPGTSITGTAAGFLAGESLRYRLDSPTGTELTGSLAGSPTPAMVPGGGGGAVVVTVPAGISDGAHSVYAVSSPSGDTGVAGIVVDGTAPPLPVLNLTPSNPSGDTVTFAYTEAEASATVECRIDADPFAPCVSPVDYSGLIAGSHTFQVRATDTVGNVSAATSYTWTVNLTVPTIAIAFPTMAGLYNDNGFNAGCGTASSGDVCGAADDDAAVTAVSVSLRRLSTGLWWNGTSFSAGTESFLAATGTADWSYAILASALPEGDFTLRARASDGSNLGYDSRTFTIDRAAPATPILTSVPSATSGPSATFAFTTNDQTAVFECRLDGGAWTSCASPRTYTNLAQGSHTVNIRALDGAGNLSAATTTTWTVDATAPTAAMTFPTATSYHLAGWAAGCGTPATGDVCGTAGDVGSGLMSVEVSVRRASTNAYWDGSTFGAPGETWLAATGTASWSFAFAGASFPTDGNYTVRWRATDAVGNTTTGGVDLTLDTTPPPAPQIISAPSDPSGGSVQFDFTTAEAGTSAECRMDAGTWATCTPPVAYSGLASGSHTFDVRATDAAGNDSAPVSYTWTVDDGLPSISISSPSPGRSYNDTAYAAGCGTPAGDICGTASDPGGGVSDVAVSIQRASTSLYWNGTSFNSPAEVFLTTTGTTSWSYVMAAASFPTEGGYTLRARATDNVGLTAIDTLTVTIDRTAPAAPTITSGPTGTTAGSGDTLSFTGEGGATFECRLDADSWAACTSPKTYGVLADGSHSFDVRALDGAGNVSATTSRTWAVDATAPTIGTAFPATAGSYNNTTYDAGCGTATTGDLCGTATDTGGTVSSVEVAARRSSTGLYWNGTGFTASTPTWFVATGTAAWSLPFAATSFPADDTYVLSVRATDAIGNVSTPATSTFSIDRTGPGAASLSAVNRGALVRRIETGDQLTLTFSEAIAPGSLIAGWDGTGTQNIVIRQANNTNDALSFYNSGNTARLPLGAVQLKRTDYVSGAVVWGAALTRSTMTLSGSTLTITFGTPDQLTRVTSAAAAANMSWSPRTGVTTGTGITDVAGNLGTSTARLETDIDNDF